MHEDVKGTNIEQEKNSKSNPSDVSKQNGKNEEYVHNQSSEKILPIDSMNEVHGGPLFYSDEIPLNASALAVENPYIRLLEWQPNESLPNGVSGIFLFINQDNIPTPVGYAVFSWQGDTSTGAHMDINRLKMTKIQQLLKEVPPDLQGAAVKSGLFEAFKIDPSVRGKGLGKLLFLVGIARMRDLGFSKVDVTGDLTINVKGTSTETFYTHMGAKVDPQTGTEILLTHEIISQNKEYISQIMFRE